MTSFVKYLRKFFAALIGIPVFIIGLILIPLPGPGLLVCVAGLFILSLEFEWVRPYLKRMRLELNKVVAKTKGRQTEHTSRPKKQKPAKAK